jgi:hypothetical protein
MLTREKRLNDSLVIVLGLRGMRGECKARFIILLFAYITTLFCLHAHAMPNKHIHAKCRDKNLNVGSHGLFKGTGVI